MNYKQIMRSREIRLWIKEILVPAGIALCVACKSPKTKMYAHKIKNEIKNKFGK